MPSSNTRAYSGYLESTRSLPPPRVPCVTPKCKVFYPETSWDTVGITINRSNSDDSNSDDSDSEDEGFDEIPDRLVGFCPGVTDDGVRQIAFQTQQALHPGLPPAALNDRIAYLTKQCEAGGLPPPCAISAVTGILPYDALPVPPGVLQDLGIEVPQVPQPLKDFFKDQELTAQVEVCFSQQHCRRPGRCPSPASIRAVFWAHTDEFDDGSCMEEVCIPVSLEVPDEGRLAELFKYAIREYTGDESLYCS